MANLGSDRYNYATTSVAGTLTINNGPCLIHNINLTDYTIGTMTFLNGTATDSGTVALILSGTPSSYNLDEELSSGLVVVTNANIKSNISYVKI